MQLLLFLIKFVAVTGPLTWWWMHGGQEAYFDFFIWVSRDILASAGVISFPPSAVRVRFMNFVPFVGLILATPRLPLPKRVWGLAVGCLIIFWSQIALAYWASVCFGSEGLTEEARLSFFPAEMLSDGLPLLLWVAFAREFVSEQLSRVFAPVTPAASGGAGSVDERPGTEPGGEPEAGAEAAEPPGDQRSTGQNLP